MLLCLLVSRLYVDEESVRGEKDGGEGGVVETDRKDHTRALLIGF